MGEESTRDLSDKRSFEERVFARFDGMESRYDEIDARFHVIDTRFLAMDKRFDAMDKRFEIGRASCRERVSIDV